MPQQKHAKTIAATTNKVVPRHYMGVKSRKVAAYTAQEKYQDWFSFKSRPFKGIFLTKYIFRDSFSNIFYYGTGYERL